MDKWGFSELDLIYSLLCPNTEMIRLMQDKNEKVPTDNDIVRTIMDIYGLTEQDAQRVLRDATSTSSMTDF
jgi:antitoxin component HigA of HigAB toxin-antitoxin module